MAKKKQKHKGTFHSWVEFTALRVVAAIVRLMPECVAAWMGRAMGYVAWRMNAKKRELARHNIKKAMPELSDKEVDRLVRRVFSNLGLGTADFLWSFKRITEPEVKRRFTFRGLEEAKAELARTPGAVAITLHLGSWEVFGSATSLMIGGLNPLARQTSNPLVEKLVAEHRETVLIRPLDADKGLRPIIAAIKKGGTRVSIMMDTHVREAFLPIKFFGREAATTTLPAVLALRFKLPVFLAYSFRKEGTLRHQIILDLLDVINTGDYDADVRANTQFFSDKLEEAVRQHPEQWLWTYRRWRLSDEREEQEQREKENASGVA